MHLMSIFTEVNLNWQLDEECESRCEYATSSCEVGFGMFWSGDVAFGMFWSCEVGFGMFWSCEVGFQGELRFCCTQQRYQTFSRSAPELGKICQLDQIYSLLMLIKPVILLPFLWIFFFSHDGVTNKDQ